MIELKRMQRLYETDTRKPLHGCSRNVLMTSCMVWESDPTNPWNTKRETDREGIRKVYESFFSTVADMTVDYTDRIVDT